MFTFQNKFNFLRAQTSYTIFKSSSAFILVCLNIVNYKTLFPAELDLPLNNQVLFCSLFFWDFNFSASMSFKVVKEGYSFFV